MIRFVADFQYFISNLEAGSGLTEIRIAMNMIHMIIAILINQDAG